MSTKTYTYAEALRVARKEGVVKLEEGVYLRSRKSILSSTYNCCPCSGSYGTDLYDYKNEFVDFRQAPFWITTDYRPSPYVCEVQPVFEENDLFYIFKLLAECELAEYE
ncbi:hypothetical protein [Stenotrophomonas maltophilia]|uniref:hypothetical protein n=1 Tax=Stenotrophomonas maltophilia TaxID=40324 RepID=UPI00066DEC84|nr:hypothetical protein [Stenotrophomonas maltophilia]